MLSVKSVERWIFTDILLLLLLLLCFSLDVPCICYGQMCLLMECFTHLEHDHRRENLSAVKSSHCHANGNVLFDFIALTSKISSVLSEDLATYFYLFHLFSFIYFFPVQMVRLQVNIFLFPKHMFCFLLRSNSHL